MTDNLVDTGVSEINEEDESIPMPVLIPFIISYLSCGFPSPAADYLEEPIDLIRTLIKHPRATVLWRAGGDSMIGRHIDVGTVMVIDKMVKPKSGDAVAVRINGEMCVREWVVDGDGKVFLKACNDNYKPIELNEFMEVEIKGTVVCSITVQKAGWL
jgi:DNA polymerase V